MGRAAGLLDRDDLVEHLQVAAGQERAPVDHHVDLVGAVGDRRPGVVQLHRQRRLTGRERGRHAGQVDAAAAQLLDRRRDHGRVDADRRHRRAATGRTDRAGGPWRTAPAPCPGCPRPPAWSGRPCGWPGRSPTALAVVLIDRVPSVAARASAPTWSTPGSPCRNVRRAASELPSRARSGSIAGRPRRQPGGRPRCHRHEPQSTLRPAWLILPRVHSQSSSNPTCVGNLAIDRSSWDRAWCAGRQLHRHLPAPPRRGDHLDPDLGRRPGPAGPPVAHGRPAPSRPGRPPGLLRLRAVPCGVAELRLSPVAAARRGGRSSSARSPGSTPTWSTSTRPDRSVCSACWPPGGSACRWCRPTTPTCTRTPRRTASRFRRCGSGVRLYARRLGVPRPPLRTDRRPPRPADGLRTPGAGGPPSTAPTCCCSATRTPWSCRPGRCSTGSACRCPTSAIHLVPTGVAARPSSPAAAALFRRSHGLDPTDQVVLFVGRVNREKGVDLLLAAFERLVADVPAGPPGAGRRRVRAALVHRAAPGDAGGRRATGRPDRTAADRRSWRRRTRRPTSSPSRPGPTPRRWCCRRRPWPACRPSWSTRSCCTDGPLGGAGV